LNTRDVIILAALAAAAVFAGGAMGCGAQQAADVPTGLDTPLAIVDNEYITVRDLLDHPGAQELVDELVYERLVLKKAEEMGLEVTEEMVLAVMEPYVSRAGGRAPFMDMQRKAGMTYEKIILHGRLGLLQEQIVEGLIEKPTYDEVVEFLETPDAAELLAQKGIELGKSAEDVTVEDVFDDAVKWLEDYRKWKVAKEGTLEQMLPSGHEVANLLRATALDDPKGDAWVAADPSVAQAEEGEALEGEPGLIEEPAADEGEGLGGSENDSKDESGDGAGLSD
jgi:hypothetical protein